MAKLASATLSVILLVGAQKAAVKWKQSGMNRDAGVQTSEVAFSQTHPVFFMPAMASSNKPAASNVIFKAGAR